MVFKFLSYDEKGFLMKITSYETPRGKWVLEDIADKFQERLDKGEKVGIGLPAGLDLVDRISEENPFHNESKT